MRTFQQYIENQPGAPMQVSAQPAQPGQGVAPTVPPPSQDSQVGQQIMQLVAKMKDPKAAGSIKQALASIIPAPGGPKVPAQMPTQAPQQPQPQPQAQPGQTPVAPGMTQQ